MHDAWVSAVSKVEAATAHSDRACTGQHALQKKIVGTYGTRKQKQASVCSLTAVRLECATSQVAMMLMWFLAAFVLDQHDDHDILVLMTNRDEAHRVGKHRLSREKVSFRVQKVRHTGSMAFSTM